MSDLHVDGVTETALALSQVAVDVKDLDALVDVAEEAADTMRGVIPVLRGDARASIQAAHLNGQAIVTFGGPRAPHGFAIARTHPSRFVEKTDRVMETRAAQILEDGITDSLTRNGLTT